MAGFFVLKAQPGDGIIGTLYNATSTSRTCNNNDYARCCRDYFKQPIFESAHAAGIRQIEVPADSVGPAIRALAWSPCEKPPKDVLLFGVSLSVVEDCEIVGENLPLVIISHGVGSNFLDHRDTAETLADNGFVVVSLNHPLDSDLDMTRSRGAPALNERPTDIKRLIDYVLRSPLLAERIDPRRIGFFGFSRGGYTGVTLAGGIPDFPGSTRDRPEDPRIKAFVLADPLSLFPTKVSLKNVIAPIQIWGSEAGDHEDVTPERVTALANDLPSKPDFQMVPNSTHTSFVAPCSLSEMKTRGIICVDPPGFDRASFHRRLNAQVLVFFRKNLRKP